MPKNDTIEMTNQEDLRAHLRSKRDKLRAAGADSRPIDSVLARVQDKRTKRTTKKDPKRS